MIGRGRAKTAMPPTVCPHAESRPALGSDSDSGQFVPWPGVAISGAERRSAGAVTAGRTTAGHMVEPRCGICRPRIPHARATFGHGTRTTPASTPGGVGFFSGQRMALLHSKARGVEFPFKENATCCAACSQCEFSHRRGRCACQTHARRESLPAAPSAALDALTRPLWRPRRPALPPG